MLHSRGQIKHDKTSNAFKELEVVLKTKIVLQTLLLRLKQSTIN